MKWPIGQKETVVLFAIALGTIAALNRTGLAAKLVM